MGDGTPCVDGIFELRRVFFARENAEQVVRLVQRFDPVGVLQNFFRQKVAVREDWKSASAARMDFLAGGRSFPAGLA